ncbi:signal peptidase I [Salinimicrobium sp. HB62]|uniref:signal peptidase I n=1 Tax=Salinimicrobium sp. HB62 TaxID=3077781 RepID=UPI002D783325|nr:signal peptidase I [Salinimicrobium sp. HB62]
MYTTKKAAVVITLIVLFLFIIKSTGLFNWYNMVTHTMEPAIQQGSTVFISNIPEIKNDDIIIFEMENFPGPVVFRAVGKEGDTVEIKNGVVFLNGQKEDQEKTLGQYKVPKSKFLQIKDSDQVFHSYQSAHLTYIDTFMVAVNRNFANSLNLEELIYDKSVEEQEIANKYSENWNRDNFGPLVIPEGKYFVLGDNRGDSYDSRYFGLLDKNNIKGKVLFRT